MPVIVFREYVKAIDVLSSEEQLSRLEVEFGPHLKKEHRKQLVSRHKRIVKSLVDRTGGKTANIQDVAKAFARMQMNG